MSANAEKSPAPGGSHGHVFVHTIETRALFRVLDDLVAESGNATNGRGVAVLGPARCGKTMLVLEYLKTRGAGDAGQTAGEHGVPRSLKGLYVLLLPPTSLKDISKHTLKALGHPAPSAGDHNSRTAQVINLIKALKYDVVVFDEIHHLVSSETKRVRENGSHWLTHIMDTTRCPMILVGYSGFGQILEENPFLSGRLLPAPPLKPYEIDNGTSFQMFRVILEDMEAALDMPQPSRLAEPETARRMLVTCNGRIGLLELFLTHARMVARRKGHNCLTLEVLRDAAEDVRYSWCKLRFNPFAVQDLEAEIGRHGANFGLLEDLPRGRPRR